MYAICKRVILKDLHLIEICWSFEQEKKNSQERFYLDMVEKRKILIEDWRSISSLKGFLNKYQGVKDSMLKIGDEFQTVPVCLKCFKIY